MTQPNGTPELEIRAPGGWGGKLRGETIAVLVVLIGALALQILVVHWDNQADAAAHAGLARNQRELIEVLEVQNWLLSTPQLKRPRLRRPVAASKYVEEDADYADR